MPQSVKLLNPQIQLRELNIGTGSRIPLCLKEDLSETILDILHMHQDCKSILSTQAQQAKKQGNHINNPT